ncbi:hypothetical protein ISS85_00370 [Candidatus Microgenomates bacterium]|nr:hypothetical protein [Candidatus Microgenomates bacterium]
MEKKEAVLLKEKKQKNDFLVKPINLLLKEKVSGVWVRFKKIIKRAAIIFSLTFSILSFCSLAYFWLLSSRGASLEKRAEQAKTKISSLKKEEQTYLFLIKKLKSAEKILKSQSSIARFLEVVDLTLPSTIIPQSLTISRNGEIKLNLFCSSLTEVENLNESLKKAIEEGKIFNAEIGGLTKEADSYKLSLSFVIQ